MLIIKSNRWVVLAENLCWSEIEREYNKRLKNQKSGAGNKPAQLVIDALIIKHLTCLSDEETISTIIESPYNAVSDRNEIFHFGSQYSPELLVHVKKRVDGKFFNTLRCLYRRNVLTRIQRKKTTTTSMEMHLHLLLTNRRLLLTKTTRSIMES